MVSGRHDRTVELHDDEYRILIMETLMRIDAKADLIIELLDGDGEEEEEADT
jgi:hypothetical protein